MTDQPYKELPYGKYRVKWGKHRCEHCKQPEYADFEVSPTGYSSGTHIDHTPDCKVNYCDECKQAWEFCDCPWSDD